MIYPYVASNDGGYATATYGPARTPSGNFCRVSPEVGGERTTGAQAEHLERCIIEFADTTTVALNDLIQVDGAQWKVDSVTLRRARRSKVVGAFRTDDTPVEVTT